MPGSRFPVPKAASSLLTHDLYFTDKKTKLQQGQGWGQATLLLSSRTASKARSPNTDTFTLTPLRAPVSFPLNSAPLHKKDFPGLRSLALQTLLSLS